MPFDRKSDRHNRLRRACGFRPGWPERLARVLSRLAGTCGRRAGAGAWVKSHRLAAGMSRKSWRKSGLSVRAISNLERGRTAQPHPRSRGVGGRVGTAGYGRERVGDPCMPLGARIALATLLSVLSVAATGSPGAGQHTLGLSRTATESI
jgi:hypothetical protein